jgi:hypothetical protein
MPEKGQLQIQKILIRWYHQMHSGSACSIPAFFDRFTAGQRESYGKAKFRRGRRGASRTRPDVMPHEAAVSKALTPDSAHVVGSTRLRLAKSCT